MIHLFFERLLKTFSGYFRKSELTVQGGYAEIWRIAWPLVILSASNTIMMLTNRYFSHGIHRRRSRRRCPPARCFLR